MKSTQLKLTRRLRPNGLVQLFFAVFLIWVRAQAGLQSFSYDAAGRIVAADYGGGKSISYAYDHAGNLVQWFQPAPGIVVDSLAGSQLTLFWPAAPAGFRLQSTSALGASAVWSDVLVTPVQMGNLNLVTVTVAGTTFFRLMAP